MTPRVFTGLMEARAAKLPVVLATRLPDGMQLLLPAEATDPALADAARAALAADQSRTVQVSGHEWFLHVHNPPLRLVVVGAVHIAQALAPLAVQIGLAVTIVDPRGAFATAERFPGVAISTDWPDEALDGLVLDSRTAVVTLTHDPKLDDPALDRALQSDSFYIGALGSRRTHAARLQRLAALGHDPHALARIRGPIGLELGAVSAPEIALSILAEFVAVHRGAALGRRQTQSREAA